MDKPMVKTSHARVDTTFRTSRTTLNGAAYATRGYAMLKVDTDVDKGKPQRSAGGIR